MSGIDIDRLAEMTPSKFMDEMTDHWPGVYEHLYAQGFRTTSTIIAELRRQSQTGSGTKPCPAQKKKKIGKEAAAQNDS